MVATEPIPRNNSREDKENKSHRTRNISAGVGGLLVAGGVGIGYLMGGGGESGVHYTPGTHESGTDAGTSADNPDSRESGNPGSSHQYTRDEIKSMADKADQPSQITDIPESALISVYSGLLDNWRQQTLDLMKPILTADQRVTLGETAPTGDKASLTDQQVINEVSEDVMDASNQTDPKEGVLMVAVPYDPRLAGYDKDVAVASSNIGKTPGQTTAVVDVYNEIDGSLPHPQGSFNGFDLSGYKQARIIRMQLQPGPNDTTEQPVIVKGLYGLREEGGKQQWQLLQRYDDNDSNTDLAINKLFGPNAPR